LSVRNNLRIAARHFYKLYFRLDKRLVHLTKVVGYASLFIGTPLYFILGLFGWSLTGLFAPPEITPAQKEARSNLQTINLPVSTTGAASSLARSDGSIKLYVAAGLLPTDTEAVYQIRKQVSAAKLTANAAEYIPLLATRNLEFNRFREIVRAELSLINTILKQAIAANIGGAEYCDALSSQVTALTEIRQMLVGSASCKEFLVRDDFLQNVSEAIAALRTLECLGWITIGISNPTQAL